MNTIYTLLVVFFLATVSTGCAGKNSSRDVWLENWLKKPVCLPPCWEYIIPGQTTLADARAALEKIPETKLTGMQGGVLVFQLGENASGRLVSDTNTIIQMVWLVFGLNPQLKIGDVISSYGFPSEGSINYFTTNEPGFDLLYSKSGMVVSTFPTNKAHSLTNPQFDIEPDEQVSGIQFFVPGLDYYKKQFLPNHAPYEIHDWTGYGNYSFLKR
jgi:hypothetical protein